MFFSEKILSWYDKNHRSFPWRIPPHDASTRPSPYRTWISETMLQQTGAATVVPYFNRFVEAFPTVMDLAHATTEDVLVHWQGLGYYRRAHHLLKSAQTIVDQGMPKTYAQWLDLPGVGPYTAAAITAIAHNQPAVAIDGNIRRVFSRYFGISGIGWLKELEKTATHHLPSARWGDYTQGLMDLGATICSTRNPACDVCPLSGKCHAFSSGTPMNWPPKTIKIKKKNLFGHICVTRDVSNTAAMRIWMQKTIGNTLLDELWRFPGSLWQDTLPQLTFSENAFFCGTIKHLFTHITLTLHVWRQDLFRPDQMDLWLQDPLVLSGNESSNGSGNGPGNDGKWIPYADISNYPLSRLMQKGLILAQTADPTPHLF